MKRFLLLFFVFVVAPVCNAEDRHENYQSFVSVNGKAEMEVEPNEIWLSVIIKEEDSRGKISLEEQEKKLFRVLKDIGLDFRESLYVEDMSSTFYKNNKGLFSKSYQLKLNEVADVFAVFQAFSNAGISNVTLLKVTRSDMDELKSRMRISAMKNAREKAVELAAAIGQKIGKAFCIVDLDYDISDRSYLSFANRKFNAGTDYDSSDMETSAEPLGFKKMKLRYSVNVKFILQ